jgi:2-dehydropantoate 2-reductase
MRILVYGAGNIGSLYAALLKESGQDVSVLARGRRLADIREDGIRLEDAASGSRSTARPRVVERLAADDDYDLVLVVLPKDRILEVLPILVANSRTPSVMFFGNNAAGFHQMTDALGSKRVLFGFPGAAAVPDGHYLRYLILSAREQPTTIGEPDGSRTQRIEAIANALRAAGFSVAICSNMDAWLKTHAVEVGPTAGAFYMAAADTHRLARTRDALLLMLRAIREGYAVLSAHGIPITPKSHKIFRWLPEPLLLALIRRAVQSETMSIKIGHALAAREEWKTIAKEIGALAESTSVSTPAIKRLNEQLDPGAALLADGSSEIPVSRNAAWIALGALALLGALLLLLL